MKTVTSARPATDAVSPELNRVAAERRPDLALLEVVERRRQRAGPQDEREILRFLLREAAGDARLGLRDPRLDHRRGPHLAVEHDRELPRRRSARSRG